MVKQTSSSENFGSYIRSLREKHNIGQRELAKKIGVAPSYLNDIEKENKVRIKRDHTISGYMLTYVVEGKMNA